MCHPIWLLSRKYGTVRYHPASSKLWYLTAWSFVNFQEKLTGTSFALCACEASFVRLAVCLALSAPFASTTWTSHGPMGPPEHLNRLKSTCTWGTDLRAHMTATPRKHTPRGGHLGSANPWIGQTDLRSADPGPSHGACPLVLEAIPRVFHST
jgi:hypothetical protein